jgi:murein DD-endopeptidase MepM/ murein hydrolase activator NlpD
MTTTRSSTHRPRRPLPFVQLCALCALVACLVTAVPVQAKTPHYAVRKGDSLSLIAKRLGVTLAHLRKKNDLEGDVIHQGQVLEVPDAFKALRPGDVRWSRPLPKGGKLLRPFGNYAQGKLVLPSTGVDVSCPVGTKVTAPAHGIVRHCQTTDGVGMVLILEHGGSYTSVLAPLDPATIDVEVGQIVVRGELLGLTAAPESSGDSPHLHVELRKDDKAVSPDRLLR